MDAELEAAIDEAGREAVFRRAREIGWSAGDPVPMWVWWQIVGEVSGPARAALGD